jgi:Uma2 family endonuclease
MTAMATHLPEGPLTVADLEAMPDDGNRYELIDGWLQVSPAPGTSHQAIVTTLSARLYRDRPAGLVVFSAPYGVRVSAKTEVQPDIVVARRDDLTEKHLPVAPLLAVEVLSPSTASNDILGKRDAYQRMGTPSYWIIDPEVPRLMVLELDTRGRYQLVADVKGDDAFDAERPFPVRVVPNELLEMLR